MKVTVLMHKWKDMPMMQGHTFSRIKYLQFQPSEEGAVGRRTPYAEGDVGTLILEGGSFPAILLENDDEETKGVSSGGEM